MKIPKEKTVRVTAIPVNTKEVILLEKRVLHRVHTIQDVYKRQQLDRARAS